ncbi:LexA family protein [Nevskia ramosa]|uniref:LexA family protein n=1 Tax=Nevskia ramosa TaxID=64002 RepID=UPI002352C11A|nr:translesion error-prone DNA polymerase V autoproteolytic subunit [Nevskia ramosa]
MTTKIHGGARPGAGRPSNYGPTVTMRVPATVAPTIRASLDSFRLRRQAEKLGLQPMALDPQPLLLKAVLTKVSAGFPSPADDYLDEGIDLNRLLVKNAPATFFYTVEDEADSMLNLGIGGGDRLLVDRSIEARNGHIVLAVIPGEGATVKELYVRGSTVRLVPHSPNPAHKPRTIKDGEEVLIVGVVTNCIKHFKT